MLLPSIGGRFPFAAPLCCRCRRRISEGALRPDQAECCTGPNSSGHRYEHQTKKPIANFVTRARKDVEAILIFHPYAPRCHTDRDRRIAAFRVTRPLAWQRSRHRGSMIRGCRRILIVGVSAQHTGEFYPPSIRDGVGLGLVAGGGDCLDGCAVGGRYAQLRSVDHGRPQRVRARIAFRDRQIGPEGDSATSATVTVAPDDGRRD